MKPKISRSFQAITLLSLVGSAPLHAASQSWKIDSDGLWIDSGNWVGDATPGSIASLDNTDTATFGETDFGVDFGPALGGEVADTGVRGGFFTGFGDKDDVAVKKRTGALEEEHRHHSGGEVGFVVKGAAAVDVASVAGGREGREGPFGGINFDGVGVAHDEEGAFGAVAFEAGDEVGSSGVFGCDGDGDAFGFEDFFDVFDDLCFVAGRVGGVDLDEGLEVAHGFVINGGLVGGLDLGGGGGGGEEG